MLPRFAAETMALAPNAGIATRYQGYIGAKQPAAPCDLPPRVTNSPRAIGITAG